MLLGVITISGLRKLRFICRRSMWKYWAGVEAHADLHVVLGAQLQEALEPGAGMFRPRAFVAVRQQHHQAAVALPFRFARRHELVDDDLGAVAEVAELRLPHHQRVRRVQRVAELEAQHRRFR